MRRFVYDLSALAVVAVPSIASAHAFGQQFNLPLPASFYILGGTCAFIASAAVILLLSKPQKSRPETNVRVLGASSSWVPIALQIFGILMFAFFVIVCGRGSQYWYENPAIELFWVVLLLGLTYLSALVDGLWFYINPFRTITFLVLDASESLKYKRGLTCAPVIMLFVLVWLELFSNGFGIVPFILGIIAILYLVLCVTGASIYGIDTWFERGDFFSVFFGLVGRFAPIRFTGKHFEVSTPARRLIADRADNLPLLFFTLVALASTAVDGLKDTAPWNQLLGRFFHQSATSTSNIFGTAILIILPVLFFALYAFAICAGKLITRSSLGVRELMLRFGFSLIPIAIAYHFAHYFNLLVGESQRLIPMMSDPFTRGWNIFGTAHYVPNLVPLGADTVWYIQLTTIVVGHVIAAIVAHQIAIRTFTTKRQILLSQIPMLIVMVFYTAFGLWILSLPFAVGQ